MSVAEAEPWWMREPPGDPEPPEPPPLAAAGTLAAPERQARLKSGGSWILDAPDTIPAAWGDGDQVLWARGEALMLVGPPGVGKTTIAGQLVRARLGLTDQVLGWPVQPGRRRLLYLAMDRPQQIARSLRRLFVEADRDALDERLVRWTGPPPADLAQDPTVLADLAKSAGADTVVIDSLKDAAIGLTDDAVAAGYNRARQTAIEAGVEVLELHHQVKRGANGGKPDTLADVYGSAWLTAGAGSVVLLWGAPGDPIVELRHLKQPADDVGPLRVIHDHQDGTSAIWRGTDLLTIARAAASGITAKAAAQALYETDKPDRNQVEKARRRLDALARSGHLIQQEGRRGGPDGGSAATWRDATLIPFIDVP